MTEVWINGQRFELSSIRVAGPPTDPSDPIAGAPEFAFQWVAEVEEYEPASIEWLHRALHGLDP